MGGERRNNYSWNKLFKKANINCLIDDGDAIIHSNEPEQIVYLEPNIYEVVHTNHSSHPIINGISRILQRFPELLKKKSRSYDGIRYSLTHKDYPNFQVVIVADSDSEYMDMSMYGTSEEVRKFRYSTKKSDYDSDYLDYNKFDIEEITNVIKWGLNNIIPQKNSNFIDNRNFFLKSISEKYRIKLFKNKSGDISIIKKGIDKSSDSPVRFEINFYGHPHINIERKKPYGWNNYYFYYSEKSIIDENIKEYSVEDVIKNY